MTETDYDVLVLGTGVAGLSAAIAAAEAGVRVGVLERATEGEHGGNTRYTEAFLRMKSQAEVSDDFEDRLVEESGYNLDPELTRDVALPPVRRSPLSKAASFLDPNVVSVFSEQAGPTLDWLTQSGIRFAQADTPFITASTTRLAPVGGGLAIVEALTQRCKDLGVQLNFVTTGEDLITDDDGRVCGVVGRQVGARRRFTAGSVILACGGFQGNPEMLAQYIPNARFARPVARGGYYNRGEGIRMALRIGAATSGDFNLFHAEPIDPRSGVAEAAVFGFGYGILVNKQGERFVDEASGTSDATYEAVTRVILDQPGGLAYAIFDANLEDVPNHQRGSRTDQPAIEDATLDGLAEKLDIPADSLVRTVNEYNAGCPEGEFMPLELDGLSTTGLKQPKSNWSRPIEASPFRAYPVMSANVFTFGGLKVNESAEVIDSDGNAIAGLYAAGELMGFYYGRYTGSTSVLRGAVFGRIAGRAAASRAKV